VNKFPPWLVCPGSSGAFFRLFSLKRHKSVGFKVSLRGIPLDIEFFEILLQQVLNGLVLGSVYALVALGYTMVYGILQLINFAHGDVLMIGAMVAVGTVSLLQGTGISGPVQLIIATLVAVPVCALVAVVMERVAYRPLRNAPRLAPLITAIGLSIVIQAIA
jgi:branched-chain amino acid transport system permease protein